MFRWHRALLDDTVLPERAREKLFAPRVREPESESRYGYGWNIRDTPDGPPRLARRRQRMDAGAAEPHSARRCPRLLDQQPRLPRRRVGPRGPGGSTDPGHHGPRPRGGALTGPPEPVFRWAHGSPCQRGGSISPTMMPSGPRREQSTFFSNSANSPMSSAPWGRKRATVSLMSSTANMTRCVPRTLCGWLRTPGVIASGLRYFASSIRL